MNTRWKRIPLLILLASAVTCTVADACTLWSAAGRSVSGEGTIISKNRDRKPTAAQTIRVIHPKTGCGFVALIAGDEGKDQGFIAAGVNQYGFTVVSATASSIPLAKRKAMPKQPRLLEKLLTSSKSVADALSHSDWLYGPRFLLMSDRRETAYVEIGPDRKISIERTGSSVLYHTNHYVSKDLLRANAAIGDSSRIRYARIAQLLRTANYPLTLKQFQSFSKDHVAGPDNSILRTGGPPSYEKTLASWIVRTPLKGSPTIYVTLRNPNQPERSYVLNVDDLLSGKASIK